MVLDYVHGLALSRRKGAGDKLATHMKLTTFILKWVIKA